LFPDNPFTPKPDAYGTTVNVPKVRIRGVDIEIPVQPFKFLELGFNGAYTDATYTKNEVVLFGGTAQQLTFYFWAFRGYAQMSRMDLCDPELGHSERGRVL